jgi:ribonuclease VapC
MIIDTSAIIAILKKEPDAETYAFALSEKKSKLISAANFLETSIVVDANGDPILSRRFDDLLSLAQVQIEPVTEAHARLARAAYNDYGKGSGHPAKLNYGDCFSYALAKATGQELLFKGNDFSETDVTSALG